MQPFLASLMRSTRPDYRNVLYFTILIIQRSIPVAKRFKARVFGSSRAATVDSNPAGGTDVCL